MVLWSLGLSVFRNLCDVAGDVLVSPMSISTGLWMAAAGTTDGSATQREFNNVLGTTAPEFTSDDSVDMATSVWIHASVKSDYITQVRAWGAELRTLKDTDPTPINAWVKEETRGKIESLVDSLDPSTKLVLVNTVSFKGSWRRPFEFANTKVGSFRSFDGHIPCKMMYQEFEEVESRYIETHHAQMVRLPYESGDLYATIILPKEEGRGPLQDVIGSLTPEFLSNLNWGKFSALRSVKLRLPRFRIEFSTDLSPRLKKLGLHAAFDGAGGFLKMSDDPDVQLGKIAHKVVLEVDEEGTDAVAATETDLEIKGIPEPPVEMTVDRPFIFMISHRKGAIFFIGKALSPDFSFTRRSELPLVDRSTTPAPASKEDSATQASRKGALEGVTGGALYIATAISLPCFVSLCAIMWASKDLFMAYPVNLLALYALSTGVCTIALTFNLYTYTDSCPATATSFPHAGLFAPASVWVLGISQNMCRIWILLLQIVHLAECCWFDWRALTFCVFVVAFVVSIFAPSPTMESCRFLLHEHSARRACVFALSFLALQLLLFAMRVRRVRHSPQRTSIALSVSPSRDAPTEIVELEAGKKRSLPTRLQRLDTIVPMLSIVFLVRSVLTAIMTVSVVKTISPTLENIYFKLGDLEIILNDIQPVVLLVLILSSPDFKPASRWLFNVRSLHGNVDVDSLPEVPDEVKRAFEAIQERTLEVAKSRRRVGKLAPPCVTGAELCTLLVEAAQARDRMQAVEIGSELVQYGFVKQAVSRPCFGIKRFRDDDGPWHLAHQNVDKAIGLEPVQIEMSFQPCESASDTLWHQ